MTYTDQIEFHNDTTQFEKPCTKILDKHIINGHGFPVKLNPTEADK